MTDQKPIPAANPAKLRRHSLIRWALATIFVVSAGASGIVLARAQKPMPQPLVKVAAAQGPDRSEDITRQMETLNNSSRHLQDVKAQCEEAQEHHARALEQFLGSVDKDASQWKLRIIQEGKTTSESPWTPPIHDVLLSAGFSRGGSVEGGAGCPERVGCANVGQLGNKCFYVCKTVAR